jgi:predicted permease
MERSSRGAPFWRRYARFWGPDVAGDVGDEVRFHLAMKQAELEARGYAPEAARREAQRSFGDVAGIQAELRAIGRRRERRVARVGALTELGQDLAQAGRVLRRRPGIPLLVVLTLGLGIGAGTAVFSLFDAVVLNPVPVAAPEELVVLGEGRAGERMGIGFPYPLVRLAREHAREARGFAGYLNLGVGLRAGEHREQALAGVVTGDYFALLGVRPQVGRLLQPHDEGVPGATPHAVLSDALWRRAFGGDPGVVGRTIVVNEAAFEVVGVAPARFRGTELAAPVDLWLPVTMVQSIGGGGLFSRPDVLETWHFGMLTLIARRAEGATSGPLVAEFAALRRSALAALPEDQAPREEADRVVLATPLGEAAAARSREELLRFLAVLAAVVAVGLAIACVNVANLLLMRTTERRRELAVRSALGADGGRLARQLSAENLLLGVAAAVLGVAIALGAMRLLAAFSLPGGIALGDLALLLDLRVLGFAAAVAVACTLAFGAAPALAARRTHVAESLRSAAHGGRFRWRGGSVLLAAQVALSVVLLVAGFLFLRSLQAGLAVDLGFRTEGVSSAAVGLRQHGYDADRAEAFIREVLERAMANPEVAGAVAASRIPIDPAPTRLPVHAADGGADAPRRALPLIAVTPGYLDFFGIPLRGGRDFAADDRAGAPRVAIVTEAAAELLWPGQDPVGRELVVLFGVPYTVVGVARDAHFTRLAEREPLVFLPLAQSLSITLERIHFAARGPDAAVALAAVRAAIHNADPRLPTFSERDAHAQLQAVLMPQRFGTLLLAVFGAVALLISAVGIYAVAAFDVVRRRRELGIRAALGAGRRRIVGGVLRRSALAVACGATAGTAAALLATRALQGLLFGIEATEPVSYGAAVLLMALVATLASWLPARRAAGVDPLLVVRE